MTKQNDDRFDALLAKAKVPGGKIRRPDLEQVANAVGGTGEDDFIEATAKLSSLEWDSGARRPEGYLELHADEWSIDLGTAANREAITWALTAAALVRENVADNSVVWVARLLPAIGDLVVTEVAGTTEVVLRITSTRVPDRLAKQVNALDFADFLDAARDAAEITVVGGVRLRVEMAS
ncbi:hypothetical protein [Umezawaea sp. NPDC059074]|uniref:hypothetical protein n=1 Tax=Umezawaea sp. NPDC059074 TaxID=3346716 RepID=UPI00369FDCC2